MATHERLELELIVEWYDEENEKASDKARNADECQEMEIVRLNFTEISFPHIHQPHEDKRTQKAFKFRIDKELRGLIKRSRLSIENF